MKSLNDVKDVLTKLKVNLLTKYPIKTLAIFGSFARNEQSEHSNLDICVEFNGVIGSRFIDLADELEDSIGLKVDLVSRNGIKQRYFAEIKDDMIYV